MLLEERQKGAPGPVYPFLPCEMPLGEASLPGCQICSPGERGRLVPVSVVCSLPGRWRSTVAGGMDQGSARMLPEYSLSKVPGRFPAISAGLPHTWGHSVGTLALFLKSPLHRVVAAGDAVSLRLSESHSFENLLVIFFL